MNILTTLFILDMVMTFPTPTIQCIPPDDTFIVEVPTPPKDEENIYGKYTNEVDPSIIYQQMEGDEDKWEDALQKAKPLDPLTDESYLQP